MPRLTAQLDDVSPLDRGATLPPHAWCRRLAIHCTLTSTYGEVARCKAPALSHTAAPRVNPLTAYIAELIIEQTAGWSQSVAHKDGEVGEAPREASYP